MAKIEGFPIPEKPLVVKNNLIVSTWRGIAYVASWPSKRPKKLPAITIEQNEWFRQANILTKYLAPELQKVARQAVKGTPLYPRDVQIQLMRGTLFSLKYDNGRTLHSVATRQGVSESLDVLSDEPYSLLVRNGTFWTFVAPGAVGEVLTSGGNEAPPTWEAGGGGSGGAIAEIAKTSAVVGGILELKGLTLDSYRTVMFDFDKITVSVAAQNLFLTLYIDDVEVVASYTTSVQVWDSNGSAVQAGVNFGTSILVNGNQLFWTIGAGLTLGCSGQFTFQDPTGTGQKGMWWNGMFFFSNNHVARFSGGGALNATGKITGFKLASGSGVITSGTIRLLGILA